MCEKCSARTSLNLQTGLKDFFSNVWSFLSCIISLFFYFFFPPFISPVSNHPPLVPRAPREGEGTVAEGKNMGISWA